MKRIIVTLSIALGAMMLQSCMNTQTLLRDEIESRPNHEIRQNFVVGDMKEISYSHTNTKWILGMVRPNYKTGRELYYDCIQNTSKEMGFPISGFFEPRCQIKTTRIPSIFTLGLVGLEFKKISLTGQPYIAKSDNMLAAPK